MRLLITGCVAKRFGGQGILLNPLLLIAIPKVETLSSIDARTLPFQCLEPVL